MYALDLSDLLELTPDDTSAAQTLAVARKLEMEIITVDRQRWLPIEEVLPFSIPLVELSDDP